MLIGDENEGCFSGNQSSWFFEVDGNDNLAVVSEQREISLPLNSQVAAVLNFAVVMAISMSLVFCFVVHENKMASC